MQRVSIPTARRFASNFMPSYVQWMVGQMYVPSPYVGGVYFFSEINGRKNYRTVLPSVYPTNMPGARIRTQNFPSTDINLVRVY